MRKFILKSVLGLTLSQEAKGAEPPPAVREMVEQAWRLDGMLTVLSQNFWFGGKK